MEYYQVTLYKKTRREWQPGSPPLTEPTTVEALDSYDAAKKVIERYLNKPVKVFGMPRPPDTRGMFFGTIRPSIVIHVEDLNILRPYTTKR